MKMSTLKDALESLRRSRHEIALDEGVRARAETVLRKMFELTR